MPFNLFTDWRGPSKTSRAEVWDCAGVPESAVGLAGRAKFQLLLFQTGEPRDGHTANMRLLGRPWRIELLSFGECVDYRKRTRHELESGRRVARRVPEEQRYDHRLLQSVRGTPWESNPGDVSTDLPEPMLIILQLTDVEPAPTQTYHSDNRGTRNVHIRKMDLERFGHDAQPAKPTALDHQCRDKNTLRNAGNDSKT